MWCRGKHSRCGSGPLDSILSPILMYRLDRSFKSLCLSFLSVYIRGMGKTISELHFSSKYSEILFIKASFSWSCNCDVNKMPEKWPSNFQREAGNGTIKISSILFKLQWEKQISSLPLSYYLFVNMIHLDS